VTHEVSATTVARYAVSLGQLEPFLAGKHLDDIDGNLIAEIVRIRRQGGTTSATVKRGLGALSSVMNFAIDQGWLESNPVLPRLKRIKERRDPIALPRPQDDERLIARALRLLAVTIAAAHATGCRQEELAGSCHDQLDRRAGRLTVIGKRNKLRVIDLSLFGGNVVFANLPGGIGRTPLFWHGANERYANVSSRFARLVREIAEQHEDFVPFRFHDLRHLHAAEWLRSGRSIYDLQQRLDHDSIKTTEVYLRYLTGAEQQVVKGLSQSTILVTADNTENHNRLKIKQQSHR
jgi:integrase/recombinase XerD